MSVAEIRRLRGKQFVAGLPAIALVGLFGVASDSLLARPSLFLLALAAFAVAMVHVFGYQRQVSALKASNRVAS